MSQNIFWQICIGKGCVVFQKINVNYRCVVKCYLHKGKSAWIAQFFADRCSCSKRAPSWRGVFWRHLTSCKLHFPLSSVRHPLKNEIMLNLIYDKFRQESTLNRCAFIHSEIPPINKRSCYLVQLRRPALLCQADPSQHPRSLDVKLFKVEYFLV